MTTAEFATQLETEYSEKGATLIAEYPEKLETDNGIETTLDWATFIYDRVEATYPSLDEDEVDEMVEEVRELMLV